MENLNGQMILDILQKLDEPASFPIIVSVVAKACGATPEQIRGTVRRTLYGGVRYGYIQYANRKYYAAEYDSEEDSVEDGNWKRKRRRKRLPPRN